MPLVSGLTVYPIKGAAGIACDKARISSTGFKYDRNWVVVMEKNGKFESQRKDPKMALIKTDLPLELFTDDLSPETEASLTLSVPQQNFGDFQVPLGVGRSSKMAQCNVWEWTGQAIDEGDLAAEYLSEFMGHKVRLMRYAGSPSKGTPEAEPSRRALNPLFAPPQTETAFSDAMPFLLANEASLADLNSRCPENIPMDRFRPNITVRGTEAWAEDSWKALKIGSIGFSSSMPTGRCTVTTVDQETGLPSKAGEPLKTLQTYRKGDLLGWTAERAWRSLVFFGWYLIASQQGIVSVGDSVEVLKTRVGAPQHLSA